jgi:hypothetical protein
MKPDFAFKHQIACIQAIYKAPCHDAVQHQRGKMVSSTLCVSNEMPGTFIFMMPQKGIHVNVRSITYVYLNSETIPPVLIQHHKESALCICVCVCACVCVWDVLSWFASALQVLIWFQGLSTSPFLWEEVCVCALCKVYHIQWFTKRYMFWRSACQHIWIIVMCSIRDNCVSFMFALSVSIPIGSLMFHMHYSAFVKGVWLYVSACIGTMHVHARIESLHVYARIPSFSCFCMCLLISKADQVSAFVCSYWEICVYLHSLAYTESWAFVCMWLESWAFVGMFQELSVYLHSVPCVESCACVVCMCLVC